MFQWSTYDLALAQCDTVVNINNSSVTITVTINNGTRHWWSLYEDDPYVLVFILDLIWWYGRNLLFLLSTTRLFRAAASLQLYCITDFLIFIDIAVNTFSVHSFLHRYIFFSTTRTQKHSRKNGCRFGTEINSIMIKNTSSMIRLN